MSGSGKATSAQPETPQRRAAAKTAAMLLRPEELRRGVDAVALGLETPSDAGPLDGTVGQARALEALRFGVGIRRRGYNLFVCGPAGTGRHTITLRHLRRAAAAEPVPDDWCYVQSFTDPRRPRAIRLPAGQGRRLRKDMDDFVQELRQAIQTAFESEEYRVRRESIAAESKEQRDKALAALAEEAERRSCVLVQTPTGMAIAPAREGEVVSHEKFRELPPGEQERIHADLELLQEQLRAALRSMPRLDRELRRKERELDRETARMAIGHLVDDLCGAWREHPAVLEHLEAVREDVLEHSDRLRAGPESALPAMLGLPMERQADDGSLLQRYRVNLLVDHDSSEGAPVVYCDHPSHGELVGRIEHQPQLGALVTNFMLIEGGALQRANGGYLVVDALKVLTQPLAWETLKRALRSHEIRIESLAEHLSLVSTVSLEPEPIPLDLKVVLVGDRRLYWTLSELDEEFPELFKVAVDFGELAERSDENLRRYAQLVVELARGEELRPLDRGAVARVLEEASRLAGDSHKLSTRTARLLDFLREADHWAGEAGSDAVHAEHVQAAVDARVRRLDRLREHVYEAVRRGTLLVDLDGERVGQVNGLSVVELGGFAFGAPSRITARVSLGKGEVVDIEREVELGGPTHSKGVLILSGLLRGRYASGVPLSLSASLVFEQSYGRVEGDSASLAELCALLSAIAEVPLRQSLAVTGSVDQHGTVQPIGGVNEKIEGFFDVCRQRGLDGEQGVIIPCGNVEHLMLRADVVAAVEQGRFHVWSVAGADQAAALLTGLEAGERDAAGRFPEGSLNARVEQRLDRLAEEACAFAARQQPEDGA